MDIINRLVIDTRNQATLTEQLDQQFTWLIATGEVRPGDLLPSVRQLAERLGISINTVRSIYAQLEADGLVETRHGAGTRVLAWDATRLIRIAATARSHTVAVILPSLANPFYHPFLDGVEEVARSEGAMLFVCNTRDDPSEAWRSFAQLAAKHVDGIIVVSHDGSAFQAPAADDVAPLLPVVTVDWPAASGYAVNVDLEGAGYQATSHLLAHGHRRVGLITFNRDDENVAAINAGYYRALREAGVAPEPGLAARMPAFDMAAGKAGAKQLIEHAGPSLGRPTAIFAIADTLAMGALIALEEAGLRVPADVALASFNDIAAAALLRPALTTVRAPTREIGVTAMRMLGELIAGRQPPQRSLVLPTSLVVRQSCGAHG